MTVVPATSASLNTAPRARGNSFPGATGPPTMGFFDFLRGSGGDGSAESGTPAVDDSPPTPEAEAFAEHATEVFDFTPASLRRLDRYVETCSEADREQSRRAFGAYLGETFVRAYDAEWRRFEDAGWVVSVPVLDTDEEMVLPLPEILADCVDGDATFAMVHDAVVADAGLDGPAVAEAPARGPPERPLPDQAVEVRADRAEGLAREFEDYDLDFSPGSFARLDALVADRYDQSPPEVDREALAAESPAGGVPEGANLRIGSGAASGRIAAYAGEVYRRSYGAAWHDGDGSDVLVVDGEGGSVELEPELLASASFAGHVSFARLHDTLAERIGLDGSVR